jgi:hypothetical protein
VKKILILIVGIVALSFAKAQLTIGNGEHQIEVGTIFSSYLNFRTIKPEASNQNKNKDRFKLRDARFYVEGRIRNDYEYKLQIDFSSLGATELDPENPALFDANITYKGFKPFNITMGYGKLPYSRASMVAFTNSPFWQRAEIARGSIFSRRDVGVTLDKSLWNNRINVYAGVYSGVGEVFYQGDNDASGALEYIGRVDVSYPSRYRYREVDDKVSPIPMISVGVNARYTKRNLPAGGSFITGQTGEYGVKVVNGERTGVGVDVAFQYKGFSAQFETHSLKGVPQNENDPLLRGLPKELTNGYFKTGGMIAQAHYFIKKANSIISVRYDELDLNDLVPGKSERLSIAAAYQISGFKSMIKAQYFKILREESIDPLRWKEQFRIGWQLALN